MNKLIAISVLSLGFVAGCQQRSETDEFSPQRSPSASPTVPAPATPMTPAPVPSSQMPGRGEGEREQQLDSPRLDASGSAVGDNALGEQYRQEIAADADLAATASSTQLVAESGQLFLRGTVVSDDLKDSLGKMAKALADGRDVTNEITVSAQ